MAISTTLSAFAVPGAHRSESLGNKPSLEVHKKAISTMGLRPEEACMVAVHKGDLAAASKVGMRTVYVQAPVEGHVGITFAEPTESSFDFEAKDYDELCRFFEV